MNRRLTARKACHLTVRYRFGRQWHPALAMDLSARGCRLRVGEDLPRGSSLNVVFETPPVAGALPRSAEVEGVVTWSRLEGLSHQAGVHFEAPPAALLDVLGALG